MKKSPTPSARLPIVLALFVALVGGSTYGLYRSFATPSPSRVARNWLNQTSGEVRQGTRAGATSSYAARAHRRTKVRHHGAKRHRLAHNAHAPKRHVKKSRHGGKSHGKRKHTSHRAAPKAYG